MKSLLAKLVVPTILIIVAGCQFYCSTYFNLSNWKGGGFGMYSEIHCFISRQVWFQSDSGYVNLGRGAENYKYGMHLKKLRIFPTDAKLAELAKELRKDKNLDTVRLQLWELGYDIKSGVLKRKKIIENAY